MNLKILILVIVVIFALVYSCGQNSYLINKNFNNTDSLENKENFEVKKSEDEWEKELGEDAFCIIRQKGTERPFTGKYVNNHDKGIYYCAACGQELFKSDTKYDSGSGWPNFFQPVDDKAITEDVDNTHGMRRVEIMCSKCGGHLGHVFEDGPKPSGLRYCVNSASLRFEKKD